jgi:hypothetical protein
VMLRVIQASLVFVSHFISVYGLSRFFWARVHFSTQAPLPPGSHSTFFKMNGCFRTTIAPSLELCTDWHHDLHLPFERTTCLSFMIGCHPSSSSHLPMRIYYTTSLALPKTPPLSRTRALNPSSIRITHMVSTHSFFEMIFPFVYIDS